MLYFNSHTREGVTIAIMICSYRNSYFNSHTREGVTLINYNITSTIKISTHTPVRV